jgi:hypothetical protein
MSHQNSSLLTSDLESTANSDSATLPATPTPLSHLDTAEESIETSEDTDTIVRIQLQIYSGGKLKKKKKKVIKIINFIIRPGRRVLVQDIEQVDLKSVFQLKI